MMRRERSRSTFWRFTITGWLTLSLSATSCAWLNEVGEIVSHAQRVVERLTPIDADTIQYEATVSDPLVYTRPWTIAFPINRQKDELLEVACHEDNQDLQHLKDIRDEARAKARSSN